MPNDRIKCSCKSVMTLEPGEQADISIISSITPDIEGDVVLPDGGDFSVFESKGKPVFLEHLSKQVGRGEWVKAKDKVIIAKTTYAKPAYWPKDIAWEGDEVYAGMKSGKLLGKSVWIQRLEDRPPTAIEKTIWQGAKRVINKWLLLDYSVTDLPANPDSMTLALAKSQKFPTITRAKLDYELLTCLRGMTPSK